MQFKAALGRHVHYVAYGTPGGEHPKTCRAAIVTELHSQDVVSLAVCNPSGWFFDQRKERDETGGMVGGTWHSPELCPQPEVTGAR